MNFKTFPLRTILTVTTGRLLTIPKGASDNGIGDLYEILGHMTGDSPFTHSLGRFAEECKPSLYEWFPELAQAEAALPSLDGWMERSKPYPGEAVTIWLAELAMTTECKEEYAIGQIPPMNHEERNPVEELNALIG